MRFSSPLSYYGGKGRLASKLIPLFPSHKIYVEPFCGSCAILFRKPRAKTEIISDGDAQLINFWQQLRDNPTDLQRYFKGRKLDHGFFLRCLAKSDTESDPVAAAGMFLFLSRTRFRGYPETKCFVPANVETFRNLLPKLPHFSQRLQGVWIHHRCAFSTLIAHNDSGTFVYNDPPYVFKDIDGTLIRGRNARVYRVEFYQHPELLSAIDRLKASTMISGYQTKMYAQALPNWRTKVFDPMPNLASATKRLVEEVIWFNY